VDSDARTYIATLRESHDRLAGLAGPLTPEQVRGQSYDSDWSNAQLLSHLGSGAELSLLRLPAAFGEGAAPGPEGNQAVWDTWNAKSPDDQAADGIESDERYVATLEGLSDEQLAAIRLDFFGMQLDAAGMVRLRLGEHALHTWDLAVMQDPAATVQQSAVGLLIDNVPAFLAPRLGKPLGEPFTVRITTTDPARDYLLIADEAISVTNWPGELSEAEADVVPHVTMPAEALLRLAYGRLDADHTPSSVSADADVLDKLRRMFPGF
jgi:uncharacterized protein (TIGR03083 family)